jgi:hypothetical protein
VHLLHTQIAWPEIVSPLADAVSFVDREERDAGGAQALRGAAVVEPLRRDLEQLDLTAVGSREAIRHLA